MVRMVLRGHHHIMGIVIEMQPVEEKTVVMVQMVQTEVMLVKVATVTL